MFIISFILNLITVSIVGLFALIVYMSYRKRPDLKSTPLDVMRDIAAGQSGHARVYKIAPFKRLLTGPVGEFGEYLMIILLVRYPGMVLKMLISGLGQVVKMSTR